MKAQFEKSKLEHAANPFIPLFRIEKKKLFQPQRQIALSVVQLMEEVFNLPQQLRTAYVEDWTRQLFRKTFMLIKCVDSTVNKEEKIIQKEILEKIIGPTNFNFIAKNASSAFYFGGGGGRERSLSSSLHPTPPPHPVPKTYLSQNNFINTANNKVSATPILNNENLNEKPQQQQQPIPHKNPINDLKKEFLDAPRRASLNVLNLENNNAQLLSTSATNAPLSNAMSGSASGPTTPISATKTMNSIKTPPSLGTPIILDVSSNKSTSSNSSGSQWSKDNQSKMKEVELSILLAMAEKFKPGIYLSVKRNPKKTADSVINELDDL